MRDRTTTRNARMALRCAPLIAIGLLATACADVPVARLDIDYKGWVSTTDRELVETIPGHASGRRRIFINERGTQATHSSRSASTAGKWDYPEGSIIVKEVYAVVDPAPGDQPAQLLGMIKDPDDPVARGGWVWVLRTVETGEERLFDNEYCVTCHSDANEVRGSDAMMQIGEPNDDGEFRDFVFFPYDPQIK